MVGFIRGLLRPKAKPDNEVIQPPEQPSNPSTQKSKAFFLEPDDAKTFGNIEYMQTSKTIKRTFPKTQGNGGEFGLVQQVSALKAAAAKGEEINVVASDPKPEIQLQPTQPLGLASTEPQKEQANTDRRRTDTSLDMFRRMARDIKKS